MKYFVVSDIHSYYTPLMFALNEAGYDKTNPNHTLIVCGDIFDRGKETLDVYKFLKSIPKKRLKLIKGNHEYLYQEALDYYFPGDGCFSNGTVSTICQVANIKGMTPAKLKCGVINCMLYLNMSEEDAFDMTRKDWIKIKDAAKRSEVTKFINGKDWLPYYEVGDYIFVHCFIPTNIKDGYLDGDVIQGYGEEPTMFKYNPNWRAVPKDNEKWYYASWGCPYKSFNAGLFDEEILKGKKLVVGHWSAEDFHEIYENDFSNNNEIYYGKNLIALDGKTHTTKNINVLIIDEDGKCYDKHHNELKVKEGL